MKQYFKIYLQKHLTTVFFSSMFLFFFQFIVFSLKITILFGM